MNSERNINSEQEFGVRQPNSEQTAQAKAIGARLKELRGGVIQSAYAAELGIGLSTLARYERGERFPDGEFLALLLRRGVDLNWLMGRPATATDQLRESLYQYMGTIGSGLPPRQAMSDFVDDYNAKSAGVSHVEGLDKITDEMVSALMTAKRPVQASMPEAEIVMVPRYNLKLGAGNGHRQWEIDKLGELGFTVSWMRKRGIKPEMAGLAEVCGVSMEPKLYDGDLVLFDRGATEIRAGKCYALRIGDEMLIKYLARLPDGAIQVSSENAARFPPFTYVPKGDDFEILGRIFSSSREWH